MTEVPEAPQHDASRLTPWALIFRPPAFEEARFAAIRVEAEQTGARTSAELFMLPAAGALLHAMTPPAGGTHAVGQVRALLFAAYRFWETGRNVYRIPDALLRDLLKDAGTAPALPHPAGYVQLPRNAFWARIAEGAAPEPVDGFFWSFDGDEGGPLELLFALGIRPGRPGLSLFDVRLETTAHLEHWSAARVREQEVDFANILPGGELQGYLALTSAAEALKLAALCLGRTGTGRWQVTQVEDQRMHEPAHG